jgi:methionine-rich copper-binding protein CopC
MVLLTRVAAVAATVLALLGLGAGSASAHTELAASEPGEGQVVTVPPQRITLTFVEAVRPVSARIEVRGPGGTSVTSGPAAVDGEVVVQPVDITRNGAYLLSYRIVAGDGHPVTGQVTFSYAGADASGAGSTAGGGSLEGAARGDSSQDPAAGPSSVEPAAAGGAVSPLLWWMLGGAVTVVAALVFLAVGRRRTPQ